MFGLILKDLLVAKKQLRFFLIILFLYAGIGMYVEHISSIAGFLIVLFSMQVMTSYAFDEQAKWNLFVMALPISKKAIIRSKYLLSVLYILIGTLFSSILILVVELFKYKTFYTTHFFSLIGFIVASIFLVSIQIPVTIKFGVEKARYVYMLIFLIPSLILFIGLRFLDKQQVKNFFIFFEQLPDWQIAWILALILCFVPLLVFYLSYRLSLTLYQKMDRVR